MASIRIRKYSADCDYDRVRSVFAAGMYSLYPRFVVEVIASSEYGQVAVGGLIVASAVAGKVLGAGPGQLMAIIACLSVLCLAATCIHVYYSLAHYVNEQLKNSMANIEQNFSAGFWVAEMDGEVVGTVGLQKIDENTAELFRLSVLEKARGLGLAKKLVQELEGRARADNFKQIILHTSTAQRPAVALYKKLGWQIRSSFMMGPFKVMKLVKNIE